ncbi:MAG: bifunctional phosphopantothenoylcysteine decarboxylase/phosphopantothenate--cysteine ligase CoaBC [Clostridia bacterium]|nr:bifunctional phosphopantothenoylcysteine decarboxylase/phosphopantothenate--cysteine ligase CoaBC [Clostridia bacterium]
MFSGKNVVIGITGGIAAYKIPNLVSMLVKQNANVRVILTDAAEKIVSPIPMESLSKNKCLTDTFDRSFTMETEHIAVADAADVFIVAPATANTIAKLAHGIADNMLTTVALACRCKKLIAPAMNTAMYENPVTRDNIETLKKYGWEVIDPVGGRLACGAVGLGKMVEPSVLFDYIERALSVKRDFSGKRIIVTAGPTREAIDPVRYITNHSSGKMGYAIAKRAALRGADVTLVSGPVSIEPPLGVEVVNIVSAEDMYNAVVSRFEGADIVIKAAAVADYRPAVTAEDKIKKSDGDMKIELERTKDIIAALGSMKREGQFLCGFSMETRDMVENSKKKLQKKNLDMIAANNVKVKGAGFAGDTNILTVITADSIRELPLLSKEEAADALLSMIAEKMGL